MPSEKGVSIVTLSRFRARPLKPAVSERWWMSGGDGTELVPYLIRGQVRGTSRGKVFVKAGGRARSSKARTTPVSLVGHSPRKPLIYQPKATIVVMSLHRRHPCASDFVKPTSASPP